MPKLSALAVLLALACLIAGPVSSGEGGQSRYVPGSLATLIDIPPTKPGWVFEGQVVHYDGSASAPIPVAGRITANLDAKSTAVLPGAVYTFEKPVLGGMYSLGGFLPVVSMDITAEVEFPRGGMTRRSDSKTGVGDVVLIPAMLAWKSGFWTYSTALFVHAPTGAYKEGRLANPGLNYWSIVPSAGLAYNNDQNGFNSSFNTGVDFNSENSDTDYQTGSSVHVDASIQQILPLGGGFLTVGVEGFWKKQYEGDSGDGATLGNFKGETQGYGPVLGYVLPVNDSSMVVELRWLKETSVQNRPKGDYFWLKFVYQFGG